MVIEETSKYITDYITKAPAKMYTWMLGDGTSPIGKIHASCGENSVLIHANFFVLERPALKEARQDCKQIYQNFLKDILKYADNQIWCYTPKPRLVRFLLDGRMTPFMFDETNGFTLLWGYARSTQ